MYCRKELFITRPFLVVLLAIVFLSSCVHKQRKKSPTGVSDETFAEKLESIMKPVDTAGGRKITAMADYVRLTYQMDDYEPLWVKESHAPNEASEKLLTELEDIRWDGIDPERYNLTAIKKLKTKLDTAHVKSLDDAIIFDTMLTRSYLAASKDLLVGEILPKKVDSLWYHVNDSTWSAPERLINSKDGYLSLDSFRSQVPTYALLRAEYKRYYALAADSTFQQKLAAVHYTAHADSGMLGAINDIIKAELPWATTGPNDTMSEEAQLLTAYQGYRGLKTTGKLDSSTYADLTISPKDYLEKLKANMERVRWMQREFGNLYVLVDVPLMELFLRKDGANAMHMRVVVGKPERQTPSLFANMANIVINPPWGVPPTILKQDVLPGFEKSGKKYLDKKGLKAYDRQGKVVNASAINVHNYKKYTYKQAPGDDNSLGYVKFNLPNKWDIYLHDTPHRGDFGKRFRALSSGCIRLQQPQEMALYILGDLEKRNYTQGRLDSMIETHKTRWEVLKTKIPVHITYLTAFEDTTGKHLQFARDIYGRDKQLISSLD